MYIFSAEPTPWIWPTLVTIASPNRTFGLINYGTYGFIEYAEALIDENFKTFKEHKTII